MAENLGMFQQLPLVPHQVEFDFIHKKVVDTLLFTRALGPCSDGDGHGQARKFG